MLKDTQNRYGGLTLALHWTSALLVFLLVAIGLSVDALPRGAARESVLDVHASIGLCLLALTLARIAWRSSQGYVRLPGELTPWEATAARLAHGAMLVILVVLPISGWMALSARGHQVSFFGLFTLPPTMAASRTLRELFEGFHAFLAFSLVGLVAVHVLAALKHHFLDGGAVLRRMLGRAAS